MATAASKKGGVLAELPATAAAGGDPSNLVSPFLRRTQLRIPKAGWAAARASDGAAAGGGGAGGGSRASPAIGRSTAAMGASPRLNAPSAPANDVGLHFSGFPVGRGAAGAARWAEDADENAWYLPLAGSRKRKPADDDDARSKRPRATANDDEEATEGEEEEEEGGEKGERREGEGEGGARLPEPVVGSASTDAESSKPRRCAADAAREVRSETENMAAVVDSPVFAVRSRESGPRKRKSRREEEEEEGGGEDGEEFQTAAARARHTEPGQEKEGGGGSGGGGGGGATTTTGVATTTGTTGGAEAVPESVKRLVMALTTQLKEERDARQKLEDGRRVLCAAVQTLQARNVELGESVDQLRREKDEAVQQLRLVRDRLGAWAGALFSLPGEGEEEDERREEEDGHENGGRRRRDDGDESGGGGGGGGGGFFPKYGEAF